MAVSPRNSAAVLPRNRLANRYSKVGSQDGGHALASWEQGMRNNVTY
jgi:hypothetical protein